MPAVHDRRTTAEYVSGATHAGVKGKDLAAIAKDVDPGRPVQGLSGTTRITRCSGHPATSAGALAVPIRHDLDEPLAQSSDNPSQQQRLS